MEDGEECGEEQEDEETEEEQGKEGQLTFTVSSAGPLPHQSWRGFLDLKV